MLNRCFSCRPSGPSAATVTSAIRCCADQTGAQLPGATIFTTLHPPSPLYSFFTFQSPAPMAYRQNSQARNPYNENPYRSPPQQQQQYREEFNEGYGGHPNTLYNDSYNDAPYDSHGGYSAYNNQQPHQTHERGGFNQHTAATQYQDDTDRSTPSPEGDPPAPPSKENLSNATAYGNDDQMAQVRPRGKLAGR